MLTLSNSIHSMRLVGSLVSNRRSNRFVSSLTATLGGNSSSVSFKTSISLGMVVDSKGQNPYSISYRTTPSDQISAFVLQISPLKISGAMQMGEPSMVLVMFAFSKLLQNPKSPSLTTPLLKKMLSGLRSLCIMLYLLSTWKASMSCLKMLSASFSGIILSLRRTDSSVPPLQNQQTKQKLLGVLSISIYLMMCQFFSMLVRMLISLTVHSSNFLFSLKRRTSITFTAYSLLSFLLVARKTLPQAPSPIISQSVQFYIIRTIQQILIMDSYTYIKSVGVRRAFVLRRLAVVMDLYFIEGQKTALLTITSILSSIASNKMPSQLSDYFMSPNFHQSSNWWNFAVCLTSTIACSRPFLGESMKKQLSQPFLCPLQLDFETYQTLIESMKDFKPALQIIHPNLQASNYSCDFTLSQPIPTKLMRKCKNGLSHLQFVVSSSSHLPIKYGNFLGVDLESEPFLHTHEVPSFDISARRFVVIIFV